MEELIAQGRFADAEDLCRELVRKDDTRGDVHRGSLARVLCLRGDAVLAETGFFDPDADRSREAEKHPRYREAMEHFRGAEEAARAALNQEVAATRADRAVIRGTLGLALYRRGKVREAVEELRRAVEEGATATGGRMAGAHNTLGLVYHDLGKDREAITQFRAALQQDPGLAEAAYNLAVHYEGRVSDLLAERRRAEEAKEDVPADQEARENEARRAALECYEQYVREARGGRIDMEGVRARIKSLKAALPAPTAGSGTGGPG